MNIHYPPVIKFVIRIDISEIENPTIKTLTEISEELYNSGYSEPTKINLISSKGPDPQMIFAPIRFLSEEDGNEILIFRDSIFFQYNEKYTTWDEILPDILKIFFFLSEKLKISMIKNVILNYIDLFDQFPQKGFDIKYYFNVNLEHPPEFTLDHNDLIIGLKLNTEEQHHKSILRIRGLKSENEEFHKIQLETLFAIREDIEITQVEQIKSNLNIAHDILIDNFKLVLTDRTKKLIVMDNEPNA